MVQQAFKVKVDENKNNKNKTEKMKKLTRKKNKRKRKKIVGRTIQIRDYSGQNRLCRVIRLKKRGQRD